MFLFHSASVVSSIGAEEAMPALETQDVDAAELDRGLGESRR